MRPRKVDSIELAKYILAKVGDTNHLKLQKLVYYVEAYHLAYFGKSIICDEFEAWLHGPVSRKIWDRLKPIANVYDNVRLKKLDDRDNLAIVKSFKKTITAEQVELIDDILGEFSKRSAYYLECLTHSEQPWKTARTGYADADKCEETIDKNEMKKFYKKNIYQ